ncbi:MAG TPA: ABC transporter ATP-binding protein [Acidimicrobiales bacterium]|nr:ABC transporter ATP-binding protein [Acidimicrobiales bacterium]
MAAIVELDDVGKVYGTGDTEVRALAGVTLAVAEGDFVAVRGPSGCGKSTLLHLAGGLEDPSTGEVRLAGAPLTALGPVELARIRRRDVGFVFQRLNLVAALTAVENVMLPLELDGMAPRRAKAEATAALAAVGIEHGIGRYPDDLSGGQQQRIAIARAVVGERRLLLADEPTGSLDSITGDAVVELLASLPETKGTAVVLVTHEPRYASWADRVVSLRDGVIVDETRAPTTDAELAGTTVTGP